MAEEVDIVLNLEDKTDSGASSAAANAQKVEQEYNKMGQAAESAALKAMKAQERQANSIMSLAKSQVSGKNSWFDSSKSDMENLETAKRITEETNRGKVAQQEKAAAAKQATQELKAQESAAKKTAAQDREIERAIKQADKGIRQATKSQQDMARASKQAANKSSFAQYDQMVRDVNRQVKAEQTAAKQSEAAQRQRAQVAEAASAQMRRAEAQYQGQLSTTRFALYDLASTYQVIGTAAAGALAGMVGAAMNFEDAFTGVERTSGLAGGELNNLREELIQLSVDMPESFENLAGIATLGGQLGIAGNAVKDFSETVAMFAATTDASIDEATTGFGRIAQLTGASQSSFDNIGASIYEVGVNSVATETEIMNVAQEIATSGDLAGFTTDKIIGLSGALASLGVRPERARGNMQRIFANIDGAVSNSGERLQQFASIAGMTSEEFATAWETNASDAFLSVVDGLGGAAAAGENLDSVLGELGIKSVRDSQTMKQLANNTDLLHMTMNDASTAYAEGTSLTDAYSTVANNLSSQLKMLRGAVMSVFAALGDSSMLGIAVAALTQLVDKTADFIRWINELGSGFKVFGTIATTVVGTVAAFALLQSGITRARAGTIAFVQSQVLLRKSTVSAASSIWKQAAAFIAGRKAAYGLARAQNGSLLAGIRAAITGTTAQKVATDASTASMTRGAVAARGFGRAISTIFGPIGIAISLLWSLGESMGVFDKFKSHSAQVKKSAMEMQINFDGLKDAIKEDTEIYRESGEALETMYRTASGAVTPMNGFAGAMLSGTSNAVSLAGGVDGLTNSIENNTIAMGENTAKYIASEMLNNEALKTFLNENSEALDSAGVSLSEYSEKLATLGTEGTVEWLQELRGEFLSTQEGIEALTDTILRNPADDFAGSLGLATEEGSELAQQLEAINDIIGITDSVGGQLASELEYVAAVQQAVGGETEDLEGKVSELASTLTNSGMFAAASFEDAMYNLGASVAENGNTLDAYSVGGRENLNALAQAVNAAAQSAGDDSAAFANYLAQIYADLFHHNRAMADTFADMMGDQMNMGSAIGNVLGGTMQDVGQKLGFVSTQSIGAARAIDTSSFAQGRAAKAAELHAAAQNKSNSASDRAAKAAKKQAEAQKKAAERVYTLSDYISDLSGVMKDAFEFRWGLQQEVDKTADAFQKMVDKQKEARDTIVDAKQSIRDYKQELRELKAEMSGLKAERNTLQYQLKVAVDYGDDIRATEIRASLKENSASISGNKNDQAKTNKDITKTQKELNQAQRDSRANLKGNSEAAREQRGDVLSLVSAYQDQITEVANSGRSQKETAKQVDRLKKKFEDQMTQLGYNRDEVKKYSKSFDDIKTIVNKVPKNLTIKVGSPADTALRQWRAKNTGGKGLSKSVPIKTKIGRPRGSGAKNWRRKNTGGRGISRPIRIPARVQFSSYGAKKAAGAASLVAKIAIETAKMQRALRRGGFRGIASAARHASYVGVYKGRLARGQYRSGGYTGRGKADEEAGTVHKGEYVLSKDKVNQSTGLPYPAALASMLARQGGTTVNASAAVPSVLQVELSPTDRNLLAQAGMTPVIAIGDKQIASATARANVASGVRGS